MTAAMDTFAFDAVSAELCGGPLDEDVQHRAALAVCARALDVDDARELLLALGIVSPPSRRRCTDVRRPREVTHDRPPISPSLAAELRAAHDAAAEPRAWPVQLPDARRPGADMHGHMVGLDRHFQAGSALCSRCRELFDYLIASGILREVAR